MIEWLFILGGAYLANKVFPSPPPRQSQGPVKTIWSVRKAYHANLKMINRLPLGAEERDAAKEAARQKMLRDLDELMG